MTQVVAEFYPTHCAFEAWGLENRSSRNFFEKVTEHKKHYPDFVCFANRAHESLRLEADTLEFFQKLSEVCSRTVVIFDSGSRIYNELHHDYLESLGFSIVYLDYFLYLCFYRLIYSGLETNSSWNQDANSFLFLTGKYYKPNRSELLYKFSQAGLLNRCEWSLPFHEQTSINVVSPIQGMSDQDFRQFFVNHVRNIDLTPSSPDGTDFNLALGMPYDTEMYRRNLFRVIAETRFGPAEKTDTFFTEKTWITIMNKVPFILAADQNALWALEQMGFRTFRKYLPVSEYDEIKPDRQRLDAIVTNTDFWINHMHNKDQIRCDVEHNFELFKQLGRDCHQQLLGLVDRLGIDIQPSDIFNILLHKITQG